MTVDGSFLLKMLEPATRPDGGGAASPPRHQPVETQSFDQLLAGQMQHHAGDASQHQAASAEQAGEHPAGGNVLDAKKYHGPLGQLARVDMVENSSLRQLIAGQSQQNQ